jgi:multicomponent Na+:H+ antiporter subunit A
MLVRWLGGATGWLLALVPAGVLVLLLGGLEPVAGGQALRAGFDWIPSLGLRLSFALDGLSLLFSLTIAAVGTLVVLYSGAYLKGHPHQGRFFAFILLFMAAMLGVVLADSTLALFTFWEMTSVTSFLLIGFDHRRQAARRAAIQALVITNIGGLALLVGAVLLWQAAGSWELGTLAQSGLQQHPLYGAILACILLAAFTKSAQFPFHFWLPNAMEAPTPVSAFLHSATMVQAGVYLLARMSPSLGGTTAWTTLLIVFGGLTLLWGAFGALRQIDLKQMLAQSTIASLGLLVLLIGIGNEAAISGMVIYFLAHACYKAGLFMVAGAVDHGTGTRNLSVLGGLADQMPVSFIGASLAALSMIGLPLTLGFFGKEEMYLALMGLRPEALLVLAVLILGNALLAGLALLVMIKPFLGPLLPTPKSPHEAPVAMLAGPILLGGAAIVAAMTVEWFGPNIVVPAAATILGEATNSHLHLAIDFRSPLLWLSVLTWALGILVYWQASTIRTVLRRGGRAMGWTADTVFDWAMFGLIRVAGLVTRRLHHGRLEIYLVVVFAALALVLLVPVLGMGGLAALWPSGQFGNWPANLTPAALHLHEWAVIALAIGGLVAVLVASSRLVAILALGIQGTAVALLYLLFGAPDLSFTQFMVEVLSVVILTLVMTRLRLDERDHRPLGEALRDGAVALACGIGVSLTLLVVLTGTLDPKLGEFFTATSVPLAHGHNIVNVILVDYRGFDTLGEISVLMATGIAILALIRGRAAAGAGEQGRPRPQPKVALEGEA